MGLFQRLFSWGQKSDPSTASVVDDGEYRWWNTGVWGTGTHAGTEVNDGNILTSATCYACTKALAETVAGLPGGIYREQGKKKLEDTEQLAYELLALQPNPEMDSYTFWELAVTRIVNRGNFFCEIQRDGADRPIALWPIHNSRVEPIRDRDGSLLWQISADYTGNPAYDDPTWRAKNLQFLSPHNMLNIVGPFSESGIIGPGMLPGAQEIGLDFAVRRYGSQFFSKGASPAGIVEHPGFIQNEGARAQFRQDINRIHSNEMAAHRVGVLWQGATYKSIQLAPEHAQFLETRKFTSDQICKFYGVPPAIIGDYDDNKFATADAMIRAFVMLTLRNLVIRIERAVNRQVLNVRDDNGKLKRAFSKPLIYQKAIDGLLRGDPITQAETHAVYRSGGILSTNEIREEIGFNPLDGEEGDYLIVNGGMSRLDKIDQQGNRSGGDDPTPPVAFDREAFAAMIAESGLVDRRVAVRGADVQDNSVIVDAAQELTVDILNRVHAIAHTQISRWREQDPAVVAEKLPKFWTQQIARLTDALGPVERMLAKAIPDSTIVSDIVEEYQSRYAALDNYDVFDSAKTDLFDVGIYFDALV